MCANHALTPRGPFHHLLDLAGYVSWRVDVQGRIRDVSESVRTFLGFEPEALIGKAIDTVLTQKDAAEVKALLKDICARATDPEVESSQRTFLSAEGRELLGEVHGCPIMDAEDRLVEVQWLTRPIEQKDYSDAEEQELILDGILRAVPFGVGVSRGGKMIWENDQMVRLTGYSHEDTRGLGHRILFEDNLEYQRVYQTVIQGIVVKGTGSVETRLVRKDGSLIDVEICATRMNLPDPLSDVILTLTDISAHKAMEAALRKSERNYRELVENANSIILRMDKTGRVTFFNDYASRFFGFSPREILGRNVIGTIVPPTETDGRDLIQEMLDLGKHPERHLTSVNENMRKDGTRVWVLWTNKPILNDQGQCVEILSIGNDITERKRAEEQNRKLEAQLKHAQKMEAVGQLAGGVAHDFNNLLQVITGYLDVLKDGLSSDAIYVDAFNGVSEAAARAADLTRQLLAFGRRQVIQPVNLDLNELIGGVLRMLQRIIGEHIELCFTAGEHLEGVKVDRGQIEQVLVNLCVNARDAMPNGGILAIKTENVYIDHEYCREHPTVKQGPYVMCTVTDTGHGIDEATLTRIFEPFFTTKQVGQGTGLGLAMVDGIVRQHNGFINIYSELGRGTEFRLYFPAVEQTTVPVEVRRDEARVGGTETILMAEDNELVLNSVSRMLENAGYTVHTAHDGEEALHVFEEHADSISLALLDVMMPKLNGREVMDQIHAKRPGIRFLFSSGYSEGGIHTDFVISRGVRLITKPYSMASLLRAVRETLDLQVADTMVSV